MTGSALDLALAYARAGYDVLPLHGIVEPAPYKIVERFEQGALNKKEAQQHARCTCGQHPCKSPGKHPRLRSIDDASRDEKTLRLWFQNPRVPTNVGIRLPPGEFAIDVDFYHPGVPDRYEAMRLRLPDTLLQKSGAGGMHLLYRSPENFNFGSTFGGAPGIDLIHHNQRYLVAAPSMHWTGHSYEWLNDRDPTPASAWVLEQAKRGARSFAPERPRRERDAEAVGLRQPLDVEDPFDWAVTLASELLEPAVSNDELESVEPGHITLSRAACHLIAGLELDEDTALEVLWEEYNPRCVPPWDDDEYEDFERTVRRAGAGAEPGYLLVKPWERQLAADAEKRATDRARSREGTASHAVSNVAASRATVSSWGDFVTVADRTKLPEPLKYLVDGLPIAPGGKVNTLNGAPNAGKSPFAMLLALCVATGKPFLGRAVLRSGPVVYVDNETGQLAEIRDDRLCHGLGVERARVPLELAHMQSVFSPEFCESLTSRLEQEPRPVLAIVDTYAGALGPELDHNSPEFAHWLRQLAIVSKLTGVAILALMHEKKTEAGKRQSALQMASGSFQAMGVAQSAIALFKEAPEDDPNLVTVVCGRAPEQGFAPFRMRWEDVEAPGSDKFKVSQHSASWGLTAKVEEGKAHVDAKVAKDAHAEEVCARSILGYLRKRPAGGASLREVQEHTRGLSKERKKDLLLLLVEEGLVVAWAAGNNDKYELGRPTKANAEARLRRGVSDIFEKT